jgi:coenzyme F420-reducing hydrogenase delta subunit
VLGLTPPPLIPYNEADMAPITRSFYADNKRVANNRIKKELGVTLKYPDFRKGIDACLIAEQSAQMQDYLPAFESSGG